MLSWNQGLLFLFQHEQFGIHGSLLKLTFLLGRLHGEKVLLQISFRNTGGLWSMGVFFAKKTKNPLLHCSLVRILWKLLFDLFSIHQVQSATVKEALLGGYSSFVGKQRKKVQRTAPLCIFWTVQKERNLRAFDNEEHSAQFLKMFFLRNLFFWVKQYIEIDCLSFFNFIEWLGYG